MSNSDSGSPMEGVTTTLQDQINEVNSRISSDLVNSQSPNGVAVGQQAAPQPSTSVAIAANSGASNDGIIQDEEQVALEKSRHLLHSKIDGKAPCNGASNTPSKSTKAVFRSPIVITKSSRKPAVAEPTNVQLNPATVPSTVEAMTNEALRNTTDGPVYDETVAVCVKPVNAESIEQLHTKKRAASSDENDVAENATKISKLNEHSTVQSAAQAHDPNSSPQTSNDPFVRPMTRSRTKKTIITTPLEPIVLKNQFALLAETKAKPVAVTSGEAATTQTNAAQSNKRSSVHTTKNGTSVLVDKIPTTVTTEEKKELRPPSITVTSADYEEVSKALEGNNLLFEWSLAQGQIRINTKSEDMRIRALDILEQKGIHCYSHMPARESRLCTVVRGLPRHPDVPQTLYDELAELGLDPLEVREIQSNRSPMYAVDFNRNAISLTFLQKNVRAMMYHRIKWEASKRKDNGPTQCKNCLMYGHGSLYCRRPPVCALCASAHRQEDCVVDFTPPPPPPPVADGQPEAPVPEFIPPFRCVHCTALRRADPRFAMHSALDPLCHVRMAKKESQRARRASIENKIAGQVTQVEANSAGQVARSNGFPQLGGRKRHQAPAAGPSRKLGKVVMAPPPPPPLIQYSEVTRTGPTAAQLRDQLKAASENAAHRAQATNSPLSGHAPGDLWTTQEVVNIMLGALNQLSQCRSKQEQMTAIVNLIAQCLD